MSVWTTKPHSTLRTYYDMVRDNRNFRLLWYGQIVTLFGDWFNLIAAAALVNSLTGSGVAVGALFVVRMLAPFLISPFAGVVADRFNRKHVLIASDIGRAVIVLGFLLVREPEQLWLLYTLIALQLGLSGFFYPARTAMLPDLVSQAQLGTANALGSATWSTMLGFGAAIGGLVAGHWGAYPSFTIDALTYVGSALLLARISYDPPARVRERGAQITAAFAAYVSGLRYLRGEVDILVTASLKAALALVMAAPFDVTQVRITESVFVYGKEGGTGLGIMFAMVGVGTGLGPIIARHFTGDRDRALRVGIVWGYVMVALGVAIMAPLVSFPVVLFGTVVRGLGGGTVWVFSTQLLLVNVAPEVRGRVFATEFMLYTLWYAISATAAGVLLESTGLGIAGMLWLMVTGNLVAAGGWLAWMLRRRSVPTPRPAVDEAV